MPFGIHSGKLLMWKHFAYHPDNSFWQNKKGQSGHENRITWGEATQQGVCNFHVKCMWWGPGGRKSWATNFTGGWREERTRSSCRNQKQIHGSARETSQEMNFRKGGDRRALARTVRKMKTKKAGGEWKWDELGQVLRESKQNERSSWVGAPSMQPAWLPLGVKDEDR